MITEYQYISTIKKGDTVTYGNGSYRVQNDRGYLHIIVKEGGIRRKISVESILFEYGSIADYIFNHWWEVYQSYDVFRAYALSELAWLNL